MIDIIKELDELKSYVAGCASTNIEYLSLSPKHPYAEGCFVEDMIYKIEALQDRISKDQEENQGKSAAARMLKTIVEQNDLPIDYQSRLLEIANLAETEMKNSKTNFHLDIPYNTSNMVKNIIIYIQSYVESGGPCTDRFIQGLYDYIDALDTKFTNLISENKSYKQENESLANSIKNWMRIKDLIYRN